MMDLVLNPSFVHRLFEEITGFYIELNRHILEAGSGKIDILLIGDDLGTPEQLTYVAGDAQAVYFSISTEIH